MIKSATWLGIFSQNGYFIWRKLAIASMLIPRIVYSPVIEWH
jgi:hypothetical protein